MSYFLSMIQILLPTKAPTANIINAGTIISASIM